MAVRWTNAAEADLARAYAFNAEKDERFATRVENRLFERAASLSGQPKQGWPIGNTDFRRISVPDIQYVLIYRIDRDDVEIVEVRHTRQDR